MEKYFPKHYNHNLYVETAPLPLVSSVYTMLALFGASIYLLSMQVDIPGSFTSVLFCLS